MTNVQHTPQQHLLPTSGRMSVPDPEPILDIVRGLSTVRHRLAGCNSLLECVLTTHATVARSLRQSLRSTKHVTSGHKYSRAHARGAKAQAPSSALMYAIIERQPLQTPHHPYYQQCKGTKSMRAMPALFDRKKAMAIDGNSEFFPCVFCGPLSEYDIDVEREARHPLHLTMHTHTCTLPQPSSHRMTRTWLPECSTTCKPQWQVDLAPTRSHCMREWCPAPSATGRQSSTATRPTWRAFSSSSRPGRIAYCGGWACTAMHRLRRLTRQTSKDGGCDGVAIHGGVMHGGVIHGG